MGRRGHSDESRSSSSDSFRRDKKLKKHKKRKKDKKKRRRHSDDDDSDSDDLSFDHRSRRGHKRERDHKRSKKRKDKRSKRTKDSDAEDKIESPHLERSFTLADALLELFTSHSALVDDLPLMLIRMGGGATFELSQMTDRHASSCLEAVFRALQSFGVSQDTSGAWQWTGPKNDLVLIRVVRALLDQIGLTEDAIDSYESNLEKRKLQMQQGFAEARSLAATRLVAEQLLKEFSNESQLPNELAGLCSMILEGESISLDGLPNEQLRASLERLFVSCRLEKTEMINDDSENEQVPTLQEKLEGFALPDIERGLSESMLQAVIELCRIEERKRTGGRRALTGPSMNPEDYAGQSCAPPRDEDSDEDEGPVPYGAPAKHSDVPSQELVKEAADARARDLHYAKTGILLPQDRDETVREEWMVDPGKFDFLSNIKSGQPVRNRGFQAQSVSAIDGEATSVRKDPKIQAEIDAIMQVHEESRGPSLMELHQQKKASEAVQTSSSRSGGSWKWDRDSDLSAGRRVDKANLKMVFGGAGTDLKQKFHKGS